MIEIELKNLWENVKTELKDKLPASAHPWIVPLEVSGYDNNILTLVTVHIMGRDILRKNYNAQITEIIRNVFKNPDANFNIIYDEIAAKKLKKENEKIQKKLSETNMKEIAMENLSNMQSTSNLNLKYKFENFVVGESNKFAHAVAMKVAQNPAQKYNPLFIYGNSGLGKTHLMQAIGHYTIFNTPNLKVKYTKTEDYVNDFISNSRKTKDTIENMSKFNKKYTNIDIILIDDIQFIESKTKTMLNMQHTFDSLYNKGKQIVITSDRLPKDIPTLTSALCSRFEMGLMVELTPPDKQVRIDILKKLAKDNDITYTEDAIEYIACNYVNNIRELEGAFNKVCAYAEINSENLDLNLAKKVLNCDNSQNELSINSITDITAKFYNANIEDLKSLSRNQKISMVRQVAIYLSRELTKESYVNIAEYFNKKHTTIMFAHDKIKKALVTDKELANDIREIKQALKLI